ncbi:Clavaminate synthase-like protein [Dothidotthia symphoricarpi CBS 119687]|uniref:Clavaminate synthase-like protein n=1 Tax=Dothidotthia symphoricarpi CBS 119687 TaxID=1392245 RepID=A0A6A6AQK5_9PLEO|nr:Clavaminate synthase-like protein [Dothidotthia symphoricarpi CBS 119687]KAF2132791.1 Clavaminate synthase-like protein [Dothidotthia symphoricarpi CBS 119687]
MAPGILAHSLPCAESRPSKKLKTSAVANLESEDEDVAVAVPSHPLGVKPAGNAYTASENIKSRCGSFARLPDELLSHIFESFDADALIRLGSTCRALYAFTRLDEIWRALFFRLDRTQPFHSMRSGVHLNENIITPRYGFFRRCHASFSKSDQSNIYEASLQLYSYQSPSSQPEAFEWRGTWRATYLNIPQENVTSIPCTNLFSDVLYRPFQCAHTPLEPFTHNIPKANEIPRLPDLTHEEYTEKWTDKPFILTEPVKQWPVYGTWTPEYLLAQFPDVKFRAEAVDWPTSTYMSYMSDNADESPLYLFDRAFAQKTNIALTGPNAAYWTPPCFGPDLFSVLGPHRPDCRWLIMGPARSGSTFHKDPNATNAWNAPLTGSKYWLMFPSGPGIPPPPGVIISDDQSEITSPLSIAEYMLTFHALARRTPGCKEGICRAGEVLHVPTGWFHLVLNLDESLALTQNFVPTKNVPDVLGFLRDQRGEVSGFRDDVCERAYELFVEGLREEYPEVLEEGLVELERRGKKGRGRWEELTKGGDEEAESGGFSFGFGGDDDDADIP